MVRKLASACHDCDHDTNTDESLVLPQETGERIDGEFVRGEAHGHCIQVRCDALRHMHSGRQQSMLTVLCGLALCVHSSAPTEIATRVVSMSACAMVRVPLRKHADGATSGSLWYACVVELRMGGESNH